MMSSDFLTAFLNLYWLRPETAAFRTCDCLAMEDIRFRAPIADVGCGDGLFSFTRAGGRLDPGYDMYHQVAQLDAFFDKADIYDHFDPQSAPPAVVQPPSYGIDVGIDHKDSLLKKADTLDFYADVRLADANVALPLDSGRFKTIFSNILYWLEGFRTTLREMCRALDDDGIVVLTVPSETFRDYSFYQKLYVRTGNPDWAWLELIDRGRSENIKLCQSFDEWRDDFAAAGFKVAHHRRYLSKLLLEGWDIGLRPISPFLIEMANKLPPEERADIKRRWIETLRPMVEPCCRLETELDREYPPGFHLFVLEKI